MKNVSPEHWNDTLSKFNFCSQKATEQMDINTVAMDFANTIKRALDICAPKKMFTIRPNYALM